jgi:hypothetical protein
MKKEYVAWKPRPQDREQVDRAEAILLDFARRGYTPTLRQLYYQFVSRGWIPNTERSYKNLGNLMSKARRAGFIDWDHMVDRMRGSVGGAHWSSPADIIRSAAAGYQIDLWEDQPVHVEVWVEKDALVDVVARAANRWDVRYLACRGYMSDSEMYQSAQRLKRKTHGGQDVVILHLGDHDPSGLDMTRDIQDRLSLFAFGNWETVDVRRIALNMDQIELYDPPPNPAKLTDSRGSSYVEEFGDSSWELDALDPDVIVALIEEHVEELVEPDLFAARQERQAQEVSQLQMVRDRWNEVVEFLTPGE